jgi:hypothetical protein
MGKKHNLPIPPRMEKHVVDGTVILLLVFVFLIMGRASPSPFPTPHSLGLTLDQ